LRGAGASQREEEEEFFLILAQEGGVRALSEWWVGVGGGWEWERL
jgi:hypothetical protein